MKVNIYEYITEHIPLTLLLIAILIILSDFISLNRFRKVRVKKRKAEKTFFDGYYNVWASNNLDNISIYKKVYDSVKESLSLYIVASEDKLSSIVHKRIFKYIVINIILSVATVIFIDLFIAKIFIILFIFLFEYIIFKLNISVKKKKLSKEFYIVLREYIEGYSIYSNVVNAFQYCLDEVSPIYSIIIQNLIKELNTTSKRDKALDNFYEKVNNKLAAGFISIIKSSFVSKEGITEALIDYQELVTKSINKKEKNELQLKRLKINIVFWFFVAFGVIIGEGYYLKTGLGNYYLTTVTGQQLLSFTSIIIIISLYIIISVRAD